MRRSHLNTTTTILTLAALLGAQFLGNAGAVICVKSDGRVLLEFGCECPHDHDHHHQERHHQTELCHFDSCTDLPIANLVLIRDLPQQTDGKQYKNATPANQGKLLALTTNHRCLLPDNPAKIPKDPLGSTDSTVLLI